MASHDSLHDPEVKIRSPSPHSHAHPHPQYPAGYNGVPSQSFESSFVNQLEQSSSGMPVSPEEDFSNLLNSNQADFDFSLYQNTSPNSTTAPEYDSSLLLDPQIHQQSRPSSQSINPADLVSPISSPQNSTSPQVPSQDNILHQHSSPGPMSPPYYTPQHSRHTSLDPSTAAYLSSHGNDWQSMMGSSAFQGHRRAPSEVSDVSSAAAHSPYMSQHESFDGVDNNNNPSPLLAPQNDPGLYDNTLGIESFTLSEHQHPQQLQGLSPSHSPYISPQLIPQQGPEMVPNVPYISPPADGNPQYPNPSTDMYGAGLDMQSQGDIGQASQMAPPSINVEFAPPSRNPTMGPKPTTDIDSLSPPTREWLLI